jgi:DnaJ domain
VGDSAAEQLAVGVFALARTKRRRFLWCAWWTATPTEKPFRPPDAWGGGARTREEAQALAERAAGRALFPIDDHWAGAWKRHLAGREPFPKPRAPKPPTEPYAVLGLTRDATLDDVKRAFRAAALTHHPDHGGSSEAFVATKRAYDAIVKRRLR